MNRRRNEWKTTWIGDRVNRRRNEEQSKSRAMEASLFALLNPFVDSSEALVVYAHAVLDRLSGWCVFMYEYMYVCMYACIYEWMYICMYVCMDRWMNGYKDI